MSVTNRIKYLILIVLICLPLSSCGLSRINEKIEVGQLERIEIKGITALELVVEFANNSRYRLEMTQGVVEIYIDSVHLMRLEQVGEVQSDPKSRGSISSLWRIKGIDPISLMSYSNRILRRDFEGMTINYSARLSANGLGRTISDKGVDLTKFMTIFAEGK